VKVPGESVDTVLTQTRKPPWAIFQVAHKLLIRFDLYGADGQDLN
jgi:hypothetical protein